MLNLSIVVPTYNESANLQILAERVFAALKQAKVDGEMLVVDDNSPDGTAKLALNLSETYPIRVIKRVKDRGLGSAIIAGIQDAHAPVVCVMDADLSHPPEAIPAMYQLIKEGQAEFVVGSRLAAGGGTSEWIWYRKIIHAVARNLGAFLTPIKDVTAGFFMFDKKIINGVMLQPTSWKIGLEIMVKGHFKKFVEYPIIFVEREKGNSKMSSKEVLAYFIHLVKLTCYKIFHRRLNKVK